MTCYYKVECRHPNEIAWDDEGEFETLNEARAAFQVLKKQLSAESGRFEIHILKMTETAVKYYDHDIRTK